MATISDTERATIEREAQEILKKFSLALAKIKVPAENTSSHEPGHREEGKGSAASTEFRSAMLANAPKHDEHAIIAEKKEW